jgi:hypothetical protein
LAVDFTNHHGYEHVACNRRSDAKAKENYSSNDSDAAHLQIWLAPISGVSIQLMLEACIPPRQYFVHHE